MSSIASTRRAPAIYAGLDAKDATGVKGKTRGFFENWIERASTAHGGEPVGMTTQGGVEAGVAP